MSDESWKGGGSKPPRQTFDQELKALLQAKPFTPFELVMPHGESIKVSDSFSLDIGEVFLDILLPRAGEVRLRKSAVVMIRLPEDTR